VCETGILTKLDYPSSWVYIITLQHTQEK